MSTITTLTSNAIAHHNVYYAYVHYANNDFNGSRVCYGVSPPCASLPLSTSMSTITTLTSKAIAHHNVYYAYVL